jgi:hypothetical protein
MGAQIDQVYADAVELRAEVLDLHTELTALKAWLTNPLFVARLLQRLLASEPVLQATAGFVVQALQNDLRAESFE